MPNDPAQPDPNAPPAAVPVAAPAAAPDPAPQPAPAADPAPAPAADAVPAADAPKPDAPAAAAAVDGIKPAAETPTLLEQLGPDGKPVEAKPADPAKPADAKPADPAKPADAAPQQPQGPEPLKYEAFVLPEGMTVADQGKYDHALGILAKHQVPPEAAQDLVTTYATAFQEFAQAERAKLADEQQRVFGETRTGWRNEIMADPVLGGAGHQTAMQAVARMRDLFVPETERGAFNDFLRMTGAGDNLHFVRLLHRVAQRFDEPAPSPLPHNPPPNPGGRGGRRGRIYDHPSSQAARNGAR